MKKFLFGGLATLTLFIFTACNGAQVITYNDKIVGLQSDIVTSIDEFVGAIQKEDAAPVELKNAHAKLKTSIEVNLKALQEIKPIEDEGFHQAALDLFKFYEKAANNEYKNIVDIYSKEEMTPEDAEKIDQMIQDLSTQEQTLHTKAQQAQEAFAQKYNFEIQ